MLLRYRLTSAPTVPGGARVAPIFDRLGALQGGLIRQHELLRTRQARKGDLLEAVPAEIMPRLAVAIRERVNVSQSQGTHDATPISFHSFGSESRATAAVSCSSVSDMRPSGMISMRGRMPSFRAARMTRRTSASVNLQGRRMELALYFRDAPTMLRRRNVVFVSQKREIIVREWIKALFPPEILETIGRQFRISDSMLDIPMPEIGL